MSLDTADLNVCDIAQRASVLLTEVGGLHVPPVMLLPLKGLGTGLALERLEVQEVDLLVVSCQLACLSEHLVAVFALKALRKGLCGGIDVAFGSSREEVH